MSRTSLPAGTRDLGRRIVGLCGSTHVVSVGCNYCGHIHFFAISGVSETLLGVQTTKNCLISRDQTI